ncbi:MAG: hemolysin family protein [Clostridia bacterium]
MLDPDGPRWYLYIVFLVLVLAGGFFAFSETAYSYCNHFRLKMWADDGNKKAKVALKITSKFDKALTTIMIGNNIFHILASVLGSVIAIKLIKSESIGSLVATIVTTLLVFIFAETLPKNIAKANSDKAALILAYPVYALMWLLTPISIIFQGMIWAAKKSFKKSDDEDKFTEDDFSDVIDSVEKEGVLDSEQSDIIQAAVDFGDIAVKDVLTPRDKIVAIDIKTPQEQLKKFLSEVSYSRLPVYDKNIDNIVGILHIRRYMKLLAMSGKHNIKEALTPTYCVLQSITLNDMFEGFKRNKTHMAIVTDSNKKTIGMVTMEDVLEELVVGINEPPVAPNRRTV